LHQKWHTPVINLAIVGIVGLAALDMDVTTSTSFINFGAFLAFTAVNISVIMLSFKGHSVIKAQGFLLAVIVPAAAAVCDLLLLFNLDKDAKVLGIVWLGIGIVYLAYLTRFFRKAPPEMVFEEKTA
jgi:putrescine importer